MLEMIKREDRWQRQDKNRRRLVCGEMKMAECGVCVCVCV